MSARLAFCLRELGIPHVQLEPAANDVWTARAGADAEQSADVPSALAALEARMVRGLRQRAESELAQAEQQAEAARETLAGLEDEHA